MRTEGCDCAENATKEESAKMDLYFKGEEVQGFPPHSKEAFHGYYEGVPEIYLQRKVPSVSKEKPKNERKAKTN